MVVTNIRQPNKFTILTPLIVIEVSVLSQGSEWSCICVLKISILLLYSIPTIFLLNFRIVPTV
jgi:hypothetical protein